MAAPALLQTLLLWRKNAFLREFFSFCVVGGTGFCVDLSLFVAAQNIANDVAARCIALSGATLLVWWLNRQFTFRSTDPLWGREFARFVVTRVLGIGVNAVISLAILWEWPEAGRTAAIAIGTIVALIVNYRTSRKWAYKIPCK